MMNDEIKKHIEAYIDSNKFRWAETTLIKERHRLNKHAWRVFKQTPEEAYADLRLSLAPYSLKTTFIRLADFSKTVTGDEVLLEDNRTAWITFTRTHANLFKYSYKRKPVKGVLPTSWLDRITNRDVRSTVEAMLKTGMRSCELETYTNGRVRGKGGKFRDLYSDITLPDQIPPYHTIYRELKKIGITPHDLRKIFLTNLINAGINIHEVAHIAGHSSINTTMRYLQVSDNQTLKEKVANATAI